MATKTEKQVRVPSVKTLMRGIITPEGFEREETTDSERWGNDSSTWPVLILKSPDVEIRIDFTTGKDRRTGYDLGSGHVTFDTPLGRRTFDRHGVEDSFYIPNPAKDPPLSGPDAPRCPFWTGDRVQHGLEKVTGTVTDPGYEKGKQVRPVSILWDTADPAVSPTYTARQLKDSKITRSDVIDRVNATIRKMIEVRIPEVRARLAESERVPTIPFTVTPNGKAEITAKLKAGGHHTFMPSGFGTGYTLLARSQPYAKRNAALAEFFGVPTVYVSTFDAD